MSKTSFRGCVGFMALVTSAGVLVVRAQQQVVEHSPTAEQIEFFEGRVRPVLAENAFSVIAPELRRPLAGSVLTADRDY